MTLSMTKIVIRHMPLCLTAMPDEDFPWAVLDSREAWKRHVRACAHARCGGGCVGRAAEPCVLDLSPSTAQNFSGFSSLAAAEADLRGTLPPADAARVLALCAAHGVADCFAARREAVNFKKVSTHRCPCVT